MLSKAQGSQIPKRLVFLLLITPSDLTLGQGGFSDEGTISFHS